MRSSEARTGRVFIIRLETGDRLPDAIERFAAEQGVAVHRIAGVHELVGVGTIFPDTGGKPSVHLHAALGRGDAAVAGCTRPGVDVWTVAEVVLVELTGTGARRAVAPRTGFELLEP